MRVFCVGDRLFSIGSSAGVHSPTSGKKERGKKQINAVIKRGFMKSKLLFLCVFFVVLIGVCGISMGPVFAQSGVDSRVSRLEAEVTTLRGQISQLQSQVNRLGNRSNSGVAAPRVEVSEPEYSAPNSIPKSMFDRLATLVIELKERMDKLEARIAALEGR